jgi:hypothetical protein
MKNEIYLAAHQSIVSGCPSPIGGMISGRAAERLAAHDDVGGMCTVLWALAGDLSDV